MTETNSSPQHTPPDPRDGKDGKWRQVARYSGLGMEMAVSIIGLSVLGYYLDGRLSHERPTLTLVLSAIGIIYVFVKIFKLASNDR